MDYDNNDHTSTWGIIAILVICFLCYNGDHKYQAISHGNNKIIVLDTTTGEAWQSYEISCGNINLKPVIYGEKQYAQEEMTTFHESYTPDKTRNDANCEWHTRLMKNFREDREKPYVNK